MDGESYRPRLKTEARRPSSTSPPSSGSEAARASTVTSTLSPFCSPAGDLPSVRGWPLDPATRVAPWGCKLAVGTRMKRAGARFSQHGGQTIMLFRTSILSYRFEAVHRELAQTYAANVKNVA